MNFFSPFVGHRNQIIFVEEGVSHLMFLVLAMLLSFEVFVEHFNVFFTLPAAISSSRLVFAGFSFSISNHFEFSLALEVEHFKMVMVSLPSEFGDANIDDFGFELIFG